uniref:Uncharacterized protein n=1 Tax=Pyxicephalus adspersus TaxID=30357 RepID=A0AAV3A538_PYXAD|nr:TPA: hypothetical protein GDO54_016846 [Pyxicephalus adspersus]
MEMVFTVSNTNLVAIFNTSLSIQHYKKVLVINTFTIEQNAIFPEINSTENAASGRQCEMEVLHLCTDLFIYRLCATISKH